mmetsp:Transcript_892/g.1214  ORF Transcript_892/g.1214 Transcript_892/m.1214 type:complete len:92 (-) Transcript_892:993-1268(-)
MTVVLLSIVGSHGYSQSNVQIKVLVGYSSQDNKGVHKIFLRGGHSVSGEDICGLSWASGTAMTQKKRKHVGDRSHLYKSKRSRNARNEGFA